MGRIARRVWVIVCVMAIALIVGRAQTRAIPLDKEGDIKLGARTYVNARVGTETTHDGVILKPGTPNEVSTSATFPHSTAGHLRQNRAFIEVKLKHDLQRLVKEGVGPFSLLNDLPFKVKGLAYYFTFRGEGDGLYDWGPKEYSTASEFNKARDANFPISFVRAQGQQRIDVGSARRRLRRLGTDRERLFEAFVEASAGNMFMRVGRQVLSWGETDGFQLLDHINPIDSSFGGFLIGLDERRVPLDMARGTYFLGEFGPISEAYLEGYVAIDKKVGFDPGAPAGSPWGLPSLSAPSNAVTTFRLGPSRTIKDARGGFLLKFNAFDATFSLAHYYTYFDTPTVQVFTNKLLTNAFNDGGQCIDPTQHNCGSPTHAVQAAPKVQVSGATTTFAVPRFYSVVRSEVAYFKDEPAFSQGQLDPFSFIGAPDHGLIGTNVALRTTGGRRLRDSFNAVIGVDMNQWIRILNPNQTFLISTQFFYKHILNHGSNNRLNADGTINQGREVLPITLDLTSNGTGPFGRLRPIFITQPADQYLQTLFIGTSYRSGTINPGLVVFYDWGGAFVYQPSITFSHDPFRFAIDYSILDSHIYKGGSGVSLLKDRDNVQFRFEYVI